MCVNIDKYARVEVAAYVRNSGNNILVLQSSSLQTRKSVVHLTMKKGRLSTFVLRQPFQFTIIGWDFLAEQLCPVEAAVQFEAGDAHCREVRPQDILTVSG